MSKKKVTFDDIAKYTNFSKTTISRYFNNPDSLTVKNQEIITTGSLGSFVIMVRFRASNFSLNSPPVWYTSSTRLIRSISSLIFPELTLEASTRSSVSCFRRWDLLSSTAM